MSYEDSVIDALNLVMAWNLPEEDLAEAMNEQASSEQCTGHSKAPNSEANHISGAISRNYLDTAGAIVQ